LKKPPPNREGFALIGKLLTKKPLHSQLIKATLAIAWKFAAPLAIEVLAPNKFLFVVSLQSHVDCILLQGPWNIRGSLHLLLVSFKVSIKKNMGGRFLIFVVLNLISGDWATLCLCW
jgi:hypothetical protein